MIYGLILFNRIETGASLADVGAELVVADDPGLRIVALKLAQQVEQGTTLGVGAGIGRLIILVQPALITDTYALIVPTRRVRADLVDRAAAVDHAVAGDVEMITDIGEAAGDVVEVADEAGIDLVGAIPGSGPAYVFRFMEALQMAGERRGLGRDAARALALGTVYGAAVLARESGEPFSTLRENVTSKGGTTAKALEVMNARDIDGMMDEAVEAALRRTAEMKALFR